MNIPKIRVPKPVLKLAGRKMLQVQKHSPTLLMAGGIVGVTTSAVLACRATLKVDQILFEGVERTKKIEEHTGLEGYSAVDATKDLTLNRVIVARELVKLYALPVALGATSVGMLLGSHKVMSSRNAGLTAAYAALDKGFDQYRARVQAELGEEKDQEFRYGKELEVLLDEKTGKQRKVIQGTDGYSIYARVFDETNRNWRRGPDYNRHFLQAQQNWANDMLRARGHIFLNEVLDMLGMERCPEGQIVGWVKGNGDNYVDFGIFEGDMMSGIRFVNGDEDSVWLDFNVDGPVYNLI